tara:strand:+ start:173 stop:1330 length:1158 start_codon:yes stop_codon:yes gene_type:complete
MSEETMESIQELNQEVDVAPEAHEDAEALSFDELDSLTDGRSGKELLSEAKKESKPKESKTKENKPETKAESNTEKSEAAEEETKEEIKKLIAKYGEEELEIAANSIFKHKIDGEEVDVELQELLNNYSGKVSYDKKFQEISSQKKDFESYKDKYDAEIKQINSYINDFANKFRQNDALGALEYFAEFSGMKPYEFRRELLNQLAPEMERRAVMTEDQIKAEELAFQNEYLMRQQESVQKQLQEEQAQKELEAEIVSVQEAHGISDEDFENAYNELVDSEYEGQINPAAVAEYYIHSTAYSKADEILGRIDPVLASQDPVVESLQKVIVENPSFDDNDLIEIVQQVYNDFKKDTSKTVSKKAITPKKQETEQSRDNEDYVDWDDI